MINAQELRIGNLVMVNGEIEEICGICEDYPFLKTVKYGVYVIEYKDLEPIPLTEEWLIRMGFQREKEHELFSGLTLILSDYIEFYSDNQDNFSDSCMFVGLRDVDMDIENHIVLYSVHQLQNLFFALTQEELKIN